MTRQVFVNRCQRGPRMASNTSNVERLLIFGVRHGLARCVASPVLSDPYSRTPRIAKEGVTEGRCSTCSTRSTLFTTCELCDHFVAGRGGKGGERKAEGGRRKAEGGRRKAEGGSELSMSLRKRIAPRGRLPERVAQFQGKPKETRRVRSSPQGGPSGASPTGSVARPESSMGVTRGTTGVPPVLSHHVTERGNLVSPL
jgi:hypothetical protein